ncbi:hydrolytic ATP binding site of dynein motor region D1-domain-containing protein, partial [Baffinella frigidus]
MAVLSVAFSQLKSILDALRLGKDKCVFDGHEVPLAREPECGAFITINPEYRGRTIIPGNLASLFRPCAMISPDVAAIIEILLMTFGFLQARMLAGKVVLLAQLSQSLLSDQEYYDWRLRSLKLSVAHAGRLLSENRGVEQEHALVAALRGSTATKLTAEDAVIFEGILRDVFPTAREQSLLLGASEGFQKAVDQACVSLSLEPEPTFTLKVLQMREALEMRWSAFIIGPASCGKSRAIATLEDAHRKMGTTTSMRALNPKAVGRHELFGFVHPATRVWKDGILARLLRDAAALAAPGGAVAAAAASLGGEEGVRSAGAGSDDTQLKLIVLDGDADVEWIESMNSVMDDNKCLTLASNERIPFMDSTKLLFEVGDMKHTSPASVSRGAVVYIPDTTVSWRSISQSWIRARPRGQSSQSDLEA